MAQHVHLRVDTGLQIYFCDPRSPWQRATNENTNGLLRRGCPGPSWNFGDGGPGVIVT